MLIFLADCWLLDSPAGVYDWLSGSAQSTLNVTEPVDFVSRVWGGGEASYPASRYCNSHSIRWAYCYACSVVFLCTVCVWVSTVKEVIYSMHRIYNLLGGCLLATIMGPPKMAEPIQVPGLLDEESEWQKKVKFFSVLVTERWARS